MVLGIMDTLNKAGDSLKSFLMSTEHNPIWVLFFIIGMAVFFFTYNALHKN
jgi:hypothetical protein